jgi:hypothetical protein
MTKLLVLVGVAIAGVFSLLVMAVAALFWMTGGMVKTADGFLGALGAKDYAGASSYLTEDFRASTPVEELAAFAQRNGLPGLKGAFWSNRESNDDRGKLEGSVTTAGGGVVPMTLALTKERGGWRIRSLRTPPAGLSANQQGAEVVPSPEQQSKLAQESFTRLTQAMDSNDFVDFHRSIATAWQREASPVELAKSFRDFLKLDELSEVQRLSPALEPATALGKDGTLTVKGRFATRPTPLTFSFGYTYEGISWKLGGVQLTFKRGEEEAALPEHPAAQRRTVGR